MSNPNDVLKTGQIVKVRVVEVDSKRKRISLTMRSGERKPALARTTITDGSVAGNGDRRPKPKPSVVENSGAMADAFAKLKSRTG